MHISGMKDHVLLARQVMTLENWPSGNI